MASQIHTGSAALSSRPKKGFLMYLQPPDMSAFVRRDHEILRHHWTMKTYCYSGMKGGILDIPLILWGVMNSHFNVSWFAYDQAYWAVRFSKRLRRTSVVILGGFDVCEEEDASFERRIPRLRYILAHADVLIAVSKRVFERAQAQLSTKREIHLIYHGFDSARFAPSGKKKRIAVTVAYLTKANAHRKGVDTFVRAAHLLPDVEFVVVGEAFDEAGEYLRSLAARNVKFLGKLSERDLIHVLQEASVYVQASFHEGFGCSLAEAMLCACVPVVSNRGAIPEVVGETGIYIEPGKPEAVAAGILQALASQELGHAARERVAELFPIPKRRDELVSTISYSLSQRGI